MTETFYSTINVLCNFVLYILMFGTFRNRVAQIQIVIFIGTFANTEIRVLRACVCKVIAAFPLADWVPLY
jgi:hypothetical protein